MGTDRTSIVKRSYSRRDFLKGISLGIAGAVALFVVPRRLFNLASKRGRQPPAVPDGSIFTPAKGTHPKI